MNPPASPSLRSANLLLASILFLTGSVRATAADWEKLPAMPMGNGAFVAGVLDSKLVLLGGTSWQNDTKLWRDSIWTFDPKKRTWAEAGHLPWPLAYPASGQAGDHLYFAGGTDGTTTGSGLWTLTSLSTPPTRQTVSAGKAASAAFAGSVVHDGKLFIVGGATEATNYQTFTNLVWAIDLKTGKAEALPPYPGGSFIMPAVTAVNHRLYVFGGASIDATNAALNLTNAYAYSLRDRQWTPLAPYPLPARGMAVCPLGKNEIFLGGGYQEGFLSRTFLYDLKKDAYRPGPPLPYAAMSTFVSNGPWLYWLGGEDKARHRSDEAYRIPLKKLR